MKTERLEVLAHFARELASLSKCTDRGVAAIITNGAGDQIFSIGINGGPKGGPDCLCTLGGKYTCVHAEANAIAKCTADREDLVMIVTLSPCITCASLIANSKISRVYYLDDYKENDGARLLNNLRIPCIKYTEQYIIRKEATDGSRIQSNTGRKD